jgi:hypothetical protein
LVLSSSEDILTAFLFFYTREPAALISWVIAQQAFNCSMILLIHALETADMSRIRRVEQAYAIFKELQDNHVHKLASLAVEKISWGLEELRKSMDGSGPRHRDSATEMQEAGQNEARRNPVGRRDTVMGNTGMFSLEEQGLQSFTSEAFAPFTWSSAGVEFATPPLVQLKQEQESPPQQEVKPLYRRKARESDNSASIAGVLKRSRRSPRESAPDRFGAAISQQLQGGGTVSAPPKCSAVRQHHGRYEEIASERHLHQSTYLPHSSHHNSPTSELSTRGWEQSIHGGGGGGGGGAIRGKDRSPPMREPNRPPMLSPQLRHNSCPLLHNPSVPACSKPTFSSPTVQKGDELMGSKDAHIYIPWTDAAAPTGQNTGHEMPLIPNGRQDQALPGYQHAFAQHHQQQQQHVGYQYPYLGHMSEPTNVSLTAADVEQMTVGEWRRWMGSNGTP